MSLGRSHHNPRWFEWWLTTTPGYISIWNSIQNPHSTPHRIFWTGSRSKTDWWTGYTAQSTKCTLTPYISRRTCSWLYSYSSHTLSHHALTCSVCYWAQKWSKHWLRETSMLVICRCNDGWLELWLRCPSNWAQSRWSSTAMVVELERISALIARISSSSLWCIGHHVLSVCRGLLAVSLCWSSWRILITTGTQSLECWDSAVWCVSFVPHQFHVLS